MEIVKIFSHKNKRSGILNNVFSVIDRIATMTTKKTVIKGSKESNDKNHDGLPDIALAAIASYKKQKEVGEFMSFLLAALERNAGWLNSIIDKQNNFKCVFMTGAGPNRFHLQEVIYPAQDENLKLEVEPKDSEDHDKIAVAALLKMPSAEIDYMIKFIKTKLNDNILLKDDLLKGKSMGISFAVLRPFSEKQFRVAERIVIENSLKCPAPFKKRRREEKLFIGPPMKTKKVA
ncbi:uncharacterized protein LOC128674224 [Plodia interpunctella]|uniref:uncharacterized protein LOC128674224 n=1 Tax=Plodia interpunctella TaxID=58824 RepID=UPI002367EF60|nr:uncharacterized protein LOC128674224 [Plodia interpunctella]